MALQLLVGLLLLVQVPLQLLLAVLQSVDLFLGLVHLTLQGLQAEIQLEGRKINNGRKVTGEPNNSFSLVHHERCKCEGKPERRGGVMTHLVLLILQRVLLLFSLHHHFFDLPLQPAVCELQVGALPETHDTVRHPTQRRSVYSSL